MPFVAFLQRKCHASWETKQRRSRLHDGVHGDVVAIGGGNVSHSFTGAHVADELFRDQNPVHGRSEDRSIALHKQGHKS